MMIPMAEEMVRIQVAISTNVDGSECVDYLNVEKNAWEAMSHDEKEECCREMAFDMVNWTYNVVTEDENQL